jgi:LuxR family maltose regulon positive regulatory protein
VVLVLDDYHLLRSCSIHDVVTFALGSLPPRVHLVVSARSSPPLPLARLRARGELLEIRAADLRFTVEETTTFLEERSGLRLPPGAAEALAARTEGWGAGLRLAALSVQDREGPGPLLAAFTGSQRLVTDYLGEEVLGHEPSEVQEFLLRTSILERFCGPLCGAVAGGGSSRGARRRPDGLGGDAGASQRMLERLERENLFLVPLDEERRWWRYQRLFAEFLRRRLEEERPEELDELHERATLWLEENGFAAEAAHHAVEARAFERAACLLEQCWRTGHLPTRPSALLGWLRALPQPLVQSRPALCLMEAWALAGTGQSEASEARLRGAVRAAPRDRSFQAQASILHGFGAALRGEARRAIRFSSQALRGLRRGHAPVAFAHLSLGLAHESLGNAEAARDGYRRARALAAPGITAERWASGSSAPQCAGTGRGPGGVASVLASIRLGEMELVRGSLREAARLFEDAAQLAAWVGDGAPCAGWPQSGLGSVFYQWNDLEAAARQLGAAIELGSRSDFGDDVPVVAYAQLAHVRQSQADPHAARRLAARSEELSRRGRGSSSLFATAEALRTQLWLRQGDLDAAARWAASHDKDSAGPPYGRDWKSAAWVRVMLAIGRPDEVAEPVQRGLRAARAAGQAGQALELEMLLALALAALGDSKAAAAALDRALVHGRPDGWVRLFLDEGEPMARLLERAARRRSATSAYARGLLAAIVRQGGNCTVPPPPPGVQRGEAVIEPLSDREREILSLIADGLSNGELAQRLLVKVATVKTHINNLFGKLGASSRTDAVARARRVGLL